MQAAANDPAQVPGTLITATVHGSSMGTHAGSSIGTPSSAHVASGAATLDSQSLHAPRSEEHRGTGIRGGTGSKRYSGAAHTSSPAGQPLEQQNANLMWC
jgi:hypothetical protein